MLVVLFVSCEGSGSGGGGGSLNVLINLGNNVLFIFKKLGIEDKINLINFESIVNLSVLILSKLINFINNVKRELFEEFRVRMDEIKVREFIFNE